MLVWPLILKSNIFSFTLWTKTYFYLRLTFYTVTHKIEFADSLIVFFDENALLFAQHERRICILNHVFISQCEGLQATLYFYFLFSCWRDSLSISANAWILCTLAIVANIFLPHVNKIIYMIGKNLQL